jgi:flagellar motility protein MotE (MotC chaperone)
MNRNSRKRFAGWLIFVLAALALLSVKLVISFGKFIHKADANPPILASEVHAADRTTRSETPGSQSSVASSQNHATLASVQAGEVSIPDMMAHLQQKESELNRKEELMRQREAYLSKMKLEVEEKLKELIGLQKEIQAYRTEKQENQNAQIRSLSKIYGSMKPKEAAKLLENLDDTLVVNIISTMNAPEAANILANMDIKKAAKISERLSKRK